MHLQPKLYQIQSGDWPTCHSRESNPDLLRGRRECYNYTTRPIGHSKIKLQVVPSFAYSSACSLLVQPVMHIYLQIVKEMLLLDARMELAQKLDGRCPSFDSSPLSLRATSLGGKFSAAIWSAGGVPRITNYGLRFTISRGYVLESKNEKNPMPVFSY